MHVRKRLFPVFCSLMVLSGLFCVSGKLLYAEQGRKPAKHAGRIDFNRDVRPILSRHCFHCHGRDEGTREAGLRLDDRKEATSQLASDAIAIVPGNPAKSELIRRITTKDVDLQMPPAETKKKLSAKEIDVLKKWIAQGAPYARHWSFTKPVRPALPETSNSSWLRNGLDAFILAKLEQAGLKPAEEADRATLIRRLSLDLRGLPPSPAEVKAFLADKRPDAYERLVDRFLHDPAYGERWARVWLDLARYADSRGYGSDPLRPNIWRYRDWVIDAFNRNLSYEQFTTEQLAGDLLPNATLDQKIATAFHRNTMTNTEGGTDDEEFRVAAVRDRVDTTIQVWMGLTMRCGTCHSHKYDPISQKEYYQFYAIFNQTADADRPDESPVISAPRRQDLEALKRVENRIAALKKQLSMNSPQLRAEQKQWEAKFRTAKGDKPRARFVRIELPGKGKLLSLAEVQVFRDGKNVAVGKPAKQSSTNFGGLAKLAVDGNTNGDYYKAKSTTHTKTETSPWWEVDLGANIPIDSLKIWNRTDNRLQSRLSNFRVVLLDASRKPVWQREIAKPPNPSLPLMPGGIRTTVSRTLLAIIDKPETKRTQKERAQLANYFRSMAPSLKGIRAEIARLEKSRPKFPTVPVMQELPPNKHRANYLMVKGNFLVKGEAVKPEVLSAFHPLKKGIPRNRLGVARWLMDSENPLTARVAVNRFWARIFGVGIVETEEDFGTQGELPTHPQLLDWLALEFQRMDWDMKGLLKLIVTSATYRQSSRVTDLKLKRDPKNRLLSRAPRIRLEAEMIRDQALALSGLLSSKMMGPSVYPPQPPGLWRAAFNGQRKWPTSQGSDRYRRGLYTFWRRTVPYPSMATFDAPSRELCTVRRIRTNTPLQALVTMNDPVYVEAARALAGRILREAGPSDESRVKFALQLCLARTPSKQQVQTLMQLAKSERAHFTRNLQAARELLGKASLSNPARKNLAEHATWTVVAGVLLNLDGVLTRN
ncbi:MAG: DUF1553 domain-containing protein [Planctomycetaceae bacterium]